jgi:hypothetical protein
MKITTRNITSAVLSLFILTVATPSIRSSFAQPQAKSLTDQLVGHWKLVSIKASNGTPDNGSPAGSMFLDRSGHFAVVVIGANNGRNISRFGTYTVDDAGSLITMHIERSSVVYSVNDPAKFTTLHIEGSTTGGPGRNVKRHISFSGNELTETSDKPSGGPGAITLTWKREN